MKPYQKITKDIIQKLVDILGEKGVSTDPDRLVQYERDEGVEREFFRTPDAVVYPKTAEDVAAVLTEKTRIMAITQMSNVLGCVNDIKGIAGLCHEKGIVLVADGAQSVPHMPVNVSELDVDVIIHRKQKHGWQMFLD